MLGTKSIKSLIGPADPARGARIPPPRRTAADLIALAAETATPASRALPRRRLLVPVSAAVAALVAGGLVARDLAGGGPAPEKPDQTGVPAPALGPVVRPVAFQVEERSPAAGERLRAFAERLEPSRCDTTTGKYTYIHTVDWNAVFDDSPGGRAQRIMPSEKKRWIAADGSARLRTTRLPAVYPNEESHRYWQEHPAPQDTGTRTDDLPARVGGYRPPPTDPAELAQHLGSGHPFLAIVGLAQSAPPLATRAEVLRFLAKTPGVVWRGEMTDRAGRKGLAVSLDDGSVEHVLVFDPRTGEVIAWDEVERPADTVAGALLILACEHTDRLG